MEMGGMFLLYSLIISSIFSYELGLIMNEAGQYHQKWGNMLSKGLPWLIVLCLQRK